MRELELLVQGMTCADCERAATRELARLPGVVDVRVDVDAGRIVVDSEAPLHRDALEAAVYDAGFDLLDVVALTR